ncbi:MAG: glycosyltransferase family 2 protein [Clostridiales bacterium]|nr:glycosyltransferase family 2 protein [Clostridiales bacterium]
MEPIFLSIVTPTYNRAPLLQNCFDSLKRQTDQDFEWIIVDDGSSDGTEEAVGNMLKEEAGFPTVYVKKENGGKHTALNASHPYINGRYVLILDSDDTLTEDAVETVRKGWAHYDKDENVGVLTFLRGKTKAQPLCISSFEYEPVDIMTAPRKIVFSADCCEVIRTELFLKYPFPVYEGERFISECALWNRVSFTHKCVYINEVIYLCEYLEGGLTKSGKPLRIRCPRGGMFTSELRMDKKNRLTQRIKYGLLYTCYGCFAGMSPGQMAKKCRAPGLTWICMPFGWLIYQYWKRKYAG